MGDFSHRRGALMQVTGIHGCVMAVRVGGDLRLTLVHKAPAAVRLICNSHLVIRLAWREHITAIPTVIVIWSRLIDKRLYLVQSSPTLYKTSISIRFIRYYLFWLILLRIIRRTFPLLLLLTFLIGWVNMLPRVIIVRRLPQIHIRATSHHSGLRAFQRDLPIIYHHTA